MEGHDRQGVGQVAGRSRRSLRQAGWYEAAAPFRYAAYAVSPEGRKMLAAP
jgi:hypothetical protein